MRWLFDFNYKLLTYVLFPFFRKYVSCFHKRSSYHHTFGMIFKARRDESDIFPLVEIPFEDGMFLAPHNSHAYLTKMFGDYMQLPQEIAVHGNIKFVN